MKLLTYFKRKITEALMWIKYFKLCKQDIFIHPFSSIGRYTKIGKGTNINGKCFIASSLEAKVYIGKYCAIAHNFRVRTRNHNMNYPNIQDKFQNRFGLVKLCVLKGDVFIGNNCWIGDNVTILPGVTVGDGAVIAAGSIVSKNVEAYSVVGGVPAKLIKYRFKSSIINELISICWWDWNDEQITNNSVFFNTDLIDYQGTLKDIIV